MLLLAATQWASKSASFHGVPPLDGISPVELCTEFLPGKSKLAQFRVWQKSSVQPAPQTPCSIEAAFLDIKSCFNIHCLAFVALLQQHFTWKGAVASSKHPAFWPPRSLLPTAVSSANFTSQTAEAISHCKLPWSVHCPNSRGAIDAGRTQNEFFLSNFLVELMTGLL